MIVMLSLCIGGCGRPSAIDAQNLPFTLQDAAGMWEGNWFGDTYFRLNVSERGKSVAYDVERGVAYLYTVEWSVNSCPNGADPAVVRFELNPVGTQCQIALTVCSLKRIGPDHLRILRVGIADAGQEFDLRRISQAEITARDVAEQKLKELELETESPNTASHGTALPRRP